MTRKPTPPRTLLLLILTGSGLWACTGSDTTRTPTDGHQTEKVQAPLEVSWRWEEADGPQPRLVLEVTPHQPVVDLGVEVRGASGLTLTPDGAMSMAQAAAGATMTVGVRCAGGGEESAEPLEVTIHGRFEALDMGRSLRVPLPGAGAGEGGAPPASGELVQDENGDLLRVLPAESRTGGR